MSLRPEGLGERGSALWEARHGDGQAVAEQILLGEACRLADRLDRLAGLLDGDSYAWAQLRFDAIDEVYDLRIDAAAAEARQAVGALRLVLAQLSPVKRPASSEPSPPSADPDDASTAEDGGKRLADELSARRAAR